MNLKNLLATEFTEGESLVVVNIDFIRQVNQEVRKGLFYLCTLCVLCGSDWDFYE